MWMQVLVRFYLLCYVILQSSSCYFLFFQFLPILNSFTAILGLLKSAKKNPGEDPETLREFIGDRIVTRSRHCSYAVLKNTNSGQNCQNCVTFLPTSSIKRHQSDDDTNVKSESEEMDDFDDYDNNEFLDNDDIEVVSEYQSFHIWYHFYF